MSTTIEDRVIILLRDKASAAELNAKPIVLPEGVKSWIGYDPGRKFGGHGFWERLGEYTGITSKRWRTVYGRKQRVTSDMLEALARIFPEHAFWLATGITDAINGHVAPINAQTFPERPFRTSSYSGDFFRAQIALFKALFDASQVNTEDEKERMYAAERTRPLAHWWDSALSDTAYKLAASQEYSDLQELWNAREIEHSEVLQKIRSAPSEAAFNGSQPTESNEEQKQRIPGIDPRTKHQSSWELFYRPKDETK